MIIYRLTLKNLINAIHKLDEPPIKLINISYDELLAKVTNGELEPGARYLINEFAQSYNIFDSNTGIIIEEQTGVLEPIIVTAASTNSIYKEAISTLYPKDIIHYSLDLIDNRDIGFGDGNGNPTANFKGMIYYREDTVQNVSTHYDFRNVKFRRWAVNAVEYSEGVSYRAKDVCKSTIDDKIYKCITATIAEGDPTVNTADWVLWLDITADAFVSWTEDRLSFNIGGIKADYLIINDVTAGVDYDDFTTFGDYYKWVKDVEIGGINLERRIDDFDFASILHSQKVFKTTDSISTCYSIKFGDNNLPMTFGTGNHSMTFRDNNSSMIFGNGNSMTFGDNNYSMTFGNSNGSMTFGNYNNSMTFGNDNNLMTFGDDTNPENVMITFGDNTTMCVFEAKCFKGLTVDLDLSAAIHIRGAYNTTIYQDAVDGTKLSYMSGGVLTIADITD